MCMILASVSRWWSSDVRMERWVGAYHWSGRIATIELTAFGRSRLGWRPGKSAFNWYR